MRRAQDGAKPKTVAAKGKSLPAKGKSLPDKQLRRRYSHIKQPAGPQRPGAQNMSSHV
jgi:hypothetical protein